MMNADDAIEFLQKNKKIVEELAREGRLSDLQLSLCVKLNIIDDNWINGKFTRKIEPLES